MRSAEDIASLPILRKSDPVFQLSLTELAFIVIFILLILFGWLLQHDRQRNVKLEQQAKKLEQQAKDAQEAASQGEAWGDIRDEIGRMFKNGDAQDKDIEKMLSDLVERKTAVAENQKLQRQVQALDAQLTALTALKAELEKATNKTDATEKAVRESLALRVALEKALGRHVSPAEMPKLVEQLAVAVQIAKDTKGVGMDVKELAKNNEHLQGLVKFYKRQIEARGGRDYPPCWPDANTGKVDYLFTVDLIPSGLMLTPAWPATRAQEARKLPNVDALMTPKGLKLGEFDNLMQGIDQHSKANNCRHYVILENHVGDLSTFNRLRFAVENFFYKYEVRK